MIKYNHEWGEIPVGMKEESFHLGIELQCYKIRLEPKDGGLGAKENFMRIVSALWNKESGKHFIWHPWAERMLEASLANKYLAISGSGSSGKTDFGAIWALVNWISDPLKTKVIVTSTSLKESRKRIWGSITEYYSAIPNFYGRLVDSMGIIKSVSVDGRIASDKVGIELIPGEKKKEKEAIGKMIGIKQDKLILIADELPELSEAILTAFYSNLSLNPQAQLIGMGNFNSMYDPFGVFCKPKLGYGSIKPDDDEWETERGLCIKFDGLKSPNIILGQDIWPIYNSEKLKEHMKLGENSALFWRMCRSHPCPEGEEHTIYSESELIRGCVHDKAVFRESAVNVAFLDPAFTNGGDRSMLQFGRIGLCTDGKTRLEFTEHVQLFENVEIKNKPRAFQIAEQFRDMCLARKVSKYNAGYDATGAGIAFGDIVDEVWSPDVLRVEFGGAASELPISVGDPRTSREAYSKRVSELWYVGLEFVRSDQIRGLPESAVKELTSRRFITKKTGEHLKVEVESKSDMKLRLGYSPDHADSICGALAVCRERLAFLAGGALGQKLVHQDKWKEHTNKTDEVFQYVDYSPEELVED